MPTPEEGRQHRRAGAFPRERVLYGVTDPRLCGRAPELLQAAVRAAFEGGVDVVQVRDKEASAEQFEALAAAAVAVARQYDDRLLIVNDRIEVALRVRADGVHVGQDDVPALKARQLVGPGVLVGVSCNTVPLARQAEADGADYLGVGAIFGTTTKLDARQDTGLDTLEAICGTVATPVVAIGGVTKDNLSLAMRAGATGTALVSGLFGAPDVTARAKVLREVMDGSKQHVQQHVQQ